MSPLPDLCPNCGAPAIGQVDDPEHQLVAVLYACGGYASRIGKIFGNDWEEFVSPELFRPKAEFMGMDPGAGEGDNAEVGLPSDLPGRVNLALLPEVQAAARDLLEYTGKSFVHVSPGARGLLGPWQRYDQTELYLGQSRGSVYWYWEVG